MQTIRLMEQELPLLPKSTELPEVRPADLAVHLRSINPYHTIPLALILGGQRLKKASITVRQVVRGSMQVSYLADDCVDMIHPHPDPFTHVRLLVPRGHGMLLSPPDNERGVQICLGHETYQAHMNLLQSWQARQVLTLNVGCAMWLA